MFQPATFGGANRRRKQENTISQLKAGSAITEPLDDLTQQRSLHAVRFVGLDVEAVERDVDSCHRQ